MFLQEIAFLAFTKKRRKKTALIVFVTTTSDAYDSLTRFFNVSIIVNIFNISLRYLSERKPFNCLFLHTGIMTSNLS